MDPDDRKPEDATPVGDEDLAQRRRMGLQNIETWVDQAIRQAERRGDFDDLPGAGKPLRHLERPDQDPDWWVKGLVEREQLDLSGAMPTGLALRRERERLPDELAGIADEARVRERLEDFNARVLADRSRPHFGPGSPVVVGRVDVDGLIEQWRSTRAAARERGLASHPDPAELPAEARTAAPARRGWWRRARRRDQT